MLADPRAWRRFRRNPGALAGAVLVVVVVAAALLGPLASPYDPNLQHQDGLTDLGVPLGPSARYLLGTDQLGRDELSRLLHGGFASLTVAFFASAVAVAVGFSVGLVAGYARGPVDALAMRLIDYVLSLPFLLVAIALNRVVNAPSLFSLALLLGLLSWTRLARVTRAKTLQVRELEFVEAARALGLPHARILVRHILPNVLGPAIVIGSTLIAQMIIVESAMSFLGLGVRPPTASWGSMLRAAIDHRGHAPQLLYLPGLLIVVTVFGFNLLGEGLRDAFDPKE
ncbi:MAG: ABC transporter permease [Sandaracinaceae bacterium]